MHRDALYVEGTGGLSMPQLGSGGLLTGILFCIYELWEGHFVAILKGSGKKAEKAFYRILKKVLPKKG